MSDDYFLQVSYAKQLGSTLERFKVKKESPFLAAARCPICGDSAKTQSKTRFTIYEKNHDLNCMCFNCGLSTTLVSYLKIHNQQLFNEFMFEKFRSNSTEPIIKTRDPPKPKKITKPIIDLPLITDLPENHPARLYIESRKLPNYPFYFAEQFYKFSSQHNDDFKSNEKDEPRIIIPFFDRAGNIFAYQGRDLSGRAKQKYITVKINPKTPLLFGYKTIDINESMLLVEGPIDSLFLPNCIASVNASLSATAKWFLAGINKNPSALTLILDNEPRNAAVVKEYERAIESRYKIVIWPKIAERCKDINDLVINGIDPVQLIKKNTYQGLEAQLMFNEWKKL